jgi:hypothetical protein
VGPIEILFLVLVAVFIVIGIVRGYARELGVTTMLLIALFVLEFVSERYQALLDKALGIATGQEAVSPLRAWIFVIVLLVITFVSYQGQTLSFPGKGNRAFFDVGVGLLNGYLFAGSIWYYLAQAGWPGLPINPPFTPFYEAMMKLLPPAVFSWPYFIGLAVILLIARVWK